MKGLTLSIRTTSDFQFSNVYIFEFSKIFRRPNHSSRENHNLKDLFQHWQFVILTVPSDNKSLKKTIQEWIQDF
jgi:hypothetical protein